MNLLQIGNLEGGHADEEGGAEDQRSGHERAQRDEGRTGAKADETPADAEEERAGAQSPVDAAAAQLGVLGGEPDGEEEAADESDGGLHAPPTRWRAMATVAMPAAMKIAVAASERGVC